MDGDVDIYGEHKKHIDDLNLESLVMVEEVKEEITVEEDEGLSKAQIKKRAKKQLKKVKRGKPGNNGVDGKVSKNLVKIIEARSTGCKVNEIVPLLQDYLKLAIEYGNKTGNTRYVIDYVLRTHKECYDLFVQVNGCKTMEDLAKVNIIC